MADEDMMADDEDSGGSSVNPLGALSQAFNTTTPEAKSYARRILDTEPTDMGEKTLLDEMQKNAEESKAALRAARQRLMARKVNPALGWLNASAALAAPTESGRFSESIGNLSKSLIPYVKAKQDLSESRDKELLGLDSSLATADQNVLLAKMRLAQIKRASEDKMRVEALKVLGREVGKTGATGSLGPNEKQARGEGFDPGTAEFNARVKQLRDQDYKVRKATAGLDEEQVSPEEHRQAAYQYGLPIPKVDPYSGMSTKRKQQAQAIDQREAESELKGSGEELLAARDSLSKADRFYQLNTDHPTGKVRGWLPALSNVDQEMDAISSDLARKMRQKGEGSTSDFDARQFLKATFDRTKNAGANRPIIQAFKAKQQNAIDFNSFRNTYYALHGHLKGSLDAWNEYLNDNQIFDSSTDAARGKYILNPNRVDYKTYFRSKLGEPVQHKADGGIIRSAAQGATMGLEDELEGVVAGDDTEKNARASVLREETDSPILAAGARGTGAALLLKGLQIARGMGLSNAALRLIPKSELLRLAMAGGSFGALTGIGSGEDGADRFQSGATGLILGSAAGPLAGLAAKHGITALGNQVARFSKDPETKADRRVIEAMERDPGVDPAQRMAEARRLRVPTTLGTSGGENLQALGRASIREGGDEADQMASAAGDRMSGSRSRVEDRVNQSLKPDEYFGHMDELTSDLYANAKPLYKTAYEAHPRIQSKKLMQILDTPAGKRAVKEAMELFQNQPGSSIGKVDATGMVKNPSLEFWDKVKQGFDQLVSKEETNGVSTPLGKSIRGLRRKLVDELDEQAPEYAAARAQYAGDLEVRDALRSGREEFNRSTPEEIRRGIKGMSFAERDAYRSGVAQRLFEEIGRPTGDYDAAKRIISSPATSDKLQAIFEKPGEFKIFKAALDREMEEFTKSKELASAAGPARLARASNDPSLINRLGATLDAVPSGGFINSAMKAMKLIPNMSEKTANQIATALREEDPTKAADYLRRIGVKAAAVSRRKKRAGKAGLAVAAITGALTAQSPHESNLDEDAP
jgi:hypothetical protein